MALEVRQSGLLEVRTQLPLSSIRKILELAEAKDLDYLSTIDLDGITVWNSLQAKRVMQELDSITMNGQGSAVRFAIEMVQGILTERVSEKIHRCLWLIGDRSHGELS